MIPAKPNTGEAKNEIYISHLAKAAMRLPHPGSNIAIIPAIRTVVTSSVMAMTPNRLSERSEKYKKHFLTFSIILACGRIL